MYPGFLLVIIIGFTYAVIVPFVSIVCALYFSIAYVIFLHNTLFVYVGTFESGGELAPTLYNYLLTGLNFANVTMMGYMIVKEGWIEFIVLLFLLPLIEGWRHRLQARYLNRARFLGRDAAVAGEARYTESHGGTPRHDSLDSKIYQQPDLSQRPFSPEHASTRDIEKSSLEVRPEAEISPISYNE